MFFRPPFFSPGHPSIRPFVLFIYRFHISTLRTFSTRKYKFAVEEKEAAVSEAMGRYRKMQRELEDAEERAERAEGTASTLRARSIRFAEEEG